MWCLCFSLTADAATTQPVKVPAPTIPWIRTRVLVEENLTPINTPNPRWVNDGKNTTPDARGNLLWVRNQDSYAYADSLGMEHYFLAYAGTFNRSPWWSTRKDQADFDKNGFGGDEAQLFDPPNETACRAIGSLSLTPERFKGKAYPHCPILIDIESGNSTFLASDTPAQRLAKLKTWKDAIGWIKAGANNGSEVWMYGQFPFWNRPTIAPDAGVDAAMAVFHASFDTPSVFQYWYDPNAENPSRWVLDFHSNDASISKVYPHGPRLVVLNPIQNVYWPQNDRPETAAKAGKPVPFDQWQLAVDALVYRGYWIAVWTGGALVDDIKPHLAYVAQYGLTPKGDATRK